MTGSYDKGGCIPGPPTLVRIEPDECVVDRNLICRRPDHHHDPGAGVRFRAEIALAIEQMRINAEGSAS